MSKPLISAFIAFLVIATILLWWFSDKQVIKRQTHALAKNLTITSGDNKSTRSLKNQSFGSLLANDFTGKLHLNNFKGEINRDDTVVGHQLLVVSCQSSEASISDFTITAITDSSATVTATLTGKVVNRTGKTYNESTSATLTWKKGDGEVWLLQNITAK